jgi:hypothetical protein
VQICSEFRSLLPLPCSGHSLGAGVAALLTLMLRELQRRGAESPPGMEGISSASPQPPHGSPTSPSKASDSRAAGSGFIQRVPGTSPRPPLSPLGAPLLIRRSSGPLEGMAPTPSSTGSGAGRRYGGSDSGTGHSGSHAPPVGGGLLRPSPSSLVPPWKEARPGDSLAALPLLPLTCCVHCVCVAPPPTLSLGLSQQCEDCVLTLVLGMDFVSR